MRRKKLYIAALVLLILSLTIFASPIISEGENWLSGYDYRKPFPIIGTSSGAQSDYQKAIEVGRTSDFLAQGHEAIGTVGGEASFEATDTDIHGNIWVGGTGANGDAVPSDRVYRSQNKGLTFSLIQDISPAHAWGDRLGFTRGYVWLIYADSHGNVYASTGGSEELYRCTDPNVGSPTFTKVLSWATPAYQESGKHTGHIHAMTEAQNGYLYVSSYGDNYEGMIWKSEDEGATWRQTDIIQGAVADDGGSQTTETTEARSATANDMTLLPATPAVNDAYYFGHFNKWHELVLEVGTAGVGTWTITWEYYNSDSSAWEALQNVEGFNSSLALTADVKQFKTSGTTYIQWEIPGDKSPNYAAGAVWSPTVVDGITAYWIRARVSAYTAITTQPLGDRAYPGHNLALSARHMHQLHFNPNNNYVYATTGEAYAGRTGDDADEVWRTKNDGDSWASICDKPGTLRPWSAIVSLPGTNDIYLGYDGSGAAGQSNIYKFTDAGGDSYTPYASGAVWTNQDPDFGTAEPGNIVLQATTMGSYILFSCMKDYANDWRWNKVVATKDGTNWVQFARTLTTTSTFGRITRNPDRFGAAFVCMSAENNFYIANDDFRDVVNVGSNCESDFDDIRFTTSDGETPLDQYLQKTIADANSATFWVELDNTPADEGTLNFYMYYGNSGASSASSVANTMLGGISDTFAGTAQDTGMWDSTDGTGVVNDWTIAGYLKMSGTASGGWDTSIVQSDDYVNGVDFILEAEHYCYGSDWRWRGGMGIYADASNWLRWRQSRYGEIPDVNALGHRYSQDGNGATAENLWDVVAPQKYIGYKIKFTNSNGNADLYVQGLNCGSVTINGFTDTNVYVMLRAEADSTETSAIDSRIRNLIFRKYADPEPIFGTWGAEEEAEAEGQVIIITTF